MVKNGRPRESRAGQCRRVKQQRRCDTNMSEYKSHASVVSFVEERCENAEPVTLSLNTKPLLQMYSVSNEAVLTPAFAFYVHFSAPVDTGDTSGVSESDPDQMRTESAAHFGLRPSAAKPLRVMLVDDHKILLDGLVRVLRPETDLEVIGTASNGEEAVKLALELKPDVIVMDVSMPGMNGVTATQKIKDQLDDVRVVGLSMHEADAMAEAMLRAGASTYLTKGCPSQELVEAIRGKS